MHSYPYWHMARVVPSVVMGFCCMVGIPGNVMVLIILRRTFESGNFTMLLMLHLALCDLLALVCLPLAIYNIMRAWALEATTCKMLFFLIHCSLNCSVLTITLLSVHRNIQVLYPHSWARLGRVGEKALLVALWGLSGTIASPALSVRDVREQTSNGSGSCTTHYQSSGQEIAILLIQTIFGFIFPSCIMVTSYLYLHRRVSQAARSRQCRLTKLVTYIVVSFFCFWTPLHVFNLLALGNVFMKSTVVEDVCPTAWDILFAFTLINSCLNPFLYAFASSAVPRRNPELTNV
ncbi:hypothetical protein DPEC_G00347890 [Dallia pectoralis]|uniref:Uncharacterized protein n=1 Tax=Dallia pectoralis TaxID=75939 RepID=A0ACC2F469_DALPE|nr:hypothetical protein DPEC_G00347890 [Dallia pectoralis]